jgi:deoxyribodipyrimidine photo-lyase
MSKKVNIFWFRRDLRLDDNVGFYEALKSEHEVLPIFIFDSEILDKLPKDDARLTFIYETLQQMRQTLQEEHGSSIAMYHGKPKSIFKTILKDYDVDSVYTNHDYEPYATERDNRIKEFLESQNITFKTFKDQVIFEKSEVVKKDGDPYILLICALGKKSLKPLI